MNLLERYIAKNILSAMTLVILMLTGLQIFILFVNQLESIGRGNYFLLNAAQFVFCRLPYEIYLFFPMASLLGCLIGLGAMANNRELIVMRAAGMSVGQITMAVFKIAIVLIVLVTFIGEMFVPRLVQFANFQKMQALSGEQIVRTKQGMWLRYHNDLINIGAIASDNKLENVYQFQIDKNHNLRLARKMAQVAYVSGHWQATDVQETVITAEKTHVKNYKAMVWDVTLQPNFIGAANRCPDEMIFSVLHRYLRVQKLNHQTSLNYQWVYWQRILQPLTTMIMIMLAIPFIFGPLRSSTMGAKLLCGASVGFGFHMINRFFGSMSQVYQWPPELAAWAPTLIFALFGLYLMWRVK